MRSSRKKPPLWLRAAYFLLGVALLLWLPLEDTTALLPLALAGLGMALAGVQLWYRLSETTRPGFWLRYPLAGLILGGSIPLLAVFLMIFKSGIHAHGFPDFSVGQQVEILQITPRTALAGLIIGLAASWRREQTRP